MPKRSRSSSVSTRRYRRRFTRANVRRSRTSYRRSRRSKTGLGGTHGFTRWGVPSPYSSVTAQGSLNFDSNQIIYTDGTMNVAPIAPATDACPFSMQFTLSDIAGAAEFAALYDRYRINGVKISIKMISVPEANKVPRTGNVENVHQTFYPTLWYCYDYDDVNLTTLDGIRQYKSARHRVLRPNKELSIFIRPKVLSQVFNSNTISGYRISQPGWIDMGNNALPHYGLKFMIDFEGIDLPIRTTVGAEVGYQFRINTKYYFQCKDVR